MSTAERKWTPEQRLGIETHDRSLLLSAAAGSGKTAVLAERCAHLVCDTKPPCGIDELLVVTFTNQAAAEMKSRIEQAIRKRLSQRESEHIARQIALMDRAQVSTLHAFCSRLLRQHFHLVGIDPNFILLEEEDALLLRGEIAREMMLAHYEEDESGDFQRLIDAYGEGNDERIIEKLIRCHNLLCSLVDPNGWLTTARARIATAAEQSLGASAAGRELLELVHRQLKDAIKRCAAAGKTVAAMDGFEKYTEYLRDLYRILQHWLQVFESCGLDDLAGEVKTQQPEKLPGISNSLPGKSIAKALVEAVRDEMKDGQLVQLLTFSETEWRAGLRAIRPHAEMFLDLVSEFAQRYARAKDDARSLDFSDLERLTLQVLREPGTDELKPSAAAKGYHRQFRHVLVDEYQDINELQDAILRLISHESIETAGSTGNLFCVGDVKQSIYGFRLAEPGRFLERHARFRQGAASPAGLVIDLQSNFRSRSLLLEAINTVFERLMTAEATDIEYDQSHRLHAGLNFPKSEAGCFTGAPIELHLLPTDVSAHDDADAGDVSEAGEMERAEIEATLIARRIHEMLATQGGGQRMRVTEKSAGGDDAFSSRPIQFRDIVILLRATRYKAEQYADILRRSGIPVFSEGHSGFFEASEVRDVLSLLSLLDNQRQDIPMAAVLRSPLAALACPEDCMARIRLAYPDKPAPIAFHEAVVRYSTEHDDELAASLRDFLGKVARWRELAHRRPLAELIWTIYDETGYLAFCNGMADGEQRSANLIHLHERARQFGSFQRQGLARFMTFLQSLESETDIGAPSVASSADDVVRIMSIHKSKGLEFPVVFIPDLGKTFNLQDCRGSILMDRRAYLGLSVVDEDRRIKYPSVVSTLVQQRLVRQILAEEMRILYVALTRAKEHLVLIGTARDTAPDQWAARWAALSGPLPPEHILSARAMLDWIGPVSAMAPAAFNVVRHGADEVAAWPSLQSLRPRMSDEQMRLAHLEPQAPPPPADALAQCVIQQLAYEYPQREFAALPAARAVTSWPDAESSESENVPTPPLRPAPDASNINRVLSLPRFLSQEGARATDVGTATHLALEHLDFERATDADSVRRQLDQMVAQKLLADEQMKLIDVNGIAWLLASEAGQILRKHARTLLRELPIYFAVPPEQFDGGRPSNDPMDRIMIRGRIDVLAPTNDGLVIIDYKTDRVTRQHVEQHAESYRAQVRHYCDAITTIAGRPVSAVYLAFLSPQMLHRI